MSAPVEEVECEEEEVHDGMANVLTNLGHYMQTSNGKMVRLDQNVDYDESVIYRYEIVIVSLVLFIKKYISLLDQEPLVV